MKVAIIRFPGTNCEFDTTYAFEKLGVKTQIVWHEEKEFDADLVVLPGGFSYGDYLRCAAIAKLAPATRVVTDRRRKPAERAVKHNKKFSASDTFIFPQTAVFVAFDDI